MIKPIFISTLEIDRLLKSSCNHYEQFNIDLLFLEYVRLDLSIISKTTKNAIYKFLLEYKDSTETLKLYVKEIERLILWIKNNNNNLDLLNINREHIIRYLQFLENPTPWNLWCGPKVPKLLNSGIINLEWKPFYKELSNTSIKKSSKIIDSFFNYLVQINILAGNPLAINRRRNKNKPVSKLVDRYLELDEINYVLEALSNKLLETMGTDKTNKNEINEDKIDLQILRAKYIILLLFYTGLRISEAAQHTMGNFILRENNWFLSIIGKGKKYREIPIPDELLDILSNFRKNIGLSYLPEFKEKTPIIPNIDLKNHLTTRRIDQILKWAFSIGAKHIEHKHPHKASKLKLASAHWLRHSYVTYLLNSGAPLKVAQENAGHSDIGTTMLYRHVNQIDRHKATRNLSVKFNNSD